MLSGRYSNEPLTLGASLNYKYPGNVYSCLTFTSSPAGAYFRLISGMRRDSAPSPHFFINTTFCVFKSVFLLLSLFLCVVDSLHHTIGRAHAKCQLPLDPRPPPHVWVPSHVCCMILPES